MNPSRFTTHSLASQPWGGNIARILAAAIQAVDPGVAIARHMHRDGDQLVIGEHTYDLSHYQRVLVIGAGKAGAPMASTVAKILGNYLTQALLVVKEGYAAGVEEQSKAIILEAGHPIPDQRGVAGTQRIVKLLLGTLPNDIVICLMSGGGSALMVSPVDGLNLEDLKSLTSALLASGATINEINTIRKHLSRVKGGNLARLAAPAQLATLILSDVVGDPFDVIASGPTVPDPTTFEEALEILQRYQIVMPTVTDVLQGRQADQAETPKTGDPLFNNVYNLIIGSNHQAAQAAINQAQEEGFNTLLLTTYLQGEARQAGRFLGAIARQIARTDYPIPKPACIVVGGETTVTLQGDGLGGRNSELALSAVEEMSDLNNITLVTLATDGGDGPTDAAGAVVTSDTLSRALQLGLVPADYLAHNDSYRFFEPLGDLLKPGPTMTNVNDLAFLFAK
jgi:hydroxypyruvate reductase